MKRLSLKIFLFVFGIAFLGFGAAVSIERFAANRAFATSGKKSTMSLAEQHPRFSNRLASADPPPVEASDSDTDAIETDRFPSEVSNPFYAEIEYQHDIDTARAYRLNVRVHPGGVWPGVRTGYIETRVRCQVRLRGVSVPLSCDTSAQRAGRPLKEIARERARWDASIAYTWALLKPQKQVRLSNPVRVAPGVVECDVAFPLGGAWHDLAAALTSDEHARIELIDGNWNWGSLHVKPY